MPIACADHSKDANLLSNRPTGGLDIIFLNIQGLKHKVHTLESFLIGTNIHIIGLTEHWLLDDEINSSFPNQFHCADAYTRSNHIRGGSSVFVHNKFVTRKCDVSQFCKEFHFEASAAFLDVEKIIIVTIYHSPSGDPYQFLNSLESLLMYITHLKNYNIVIGGDFNINFDVTKNSKTSKDLLNLFRQYNFYHHNNKPTRGNNCLDNVFISTHNLIISSVTTFLFPFSDHDGILVQTLFKEKYSKKGDCLKPIHDQLQLHLAPKNIEALSVRLASFNWHSFLDKNTNENSDVLFSNFFNVINNHLNYYSRATNVKGKRSDERNKLNNDWFTHELATMKKSCYFWTA